MNVPGRLQRLLGLASIRPTTAPLIALFVMDLTDRFTISLTLSSRILNRKKSKGKTMNPEDIKQDLEHGESIDRLDAAYLALLEYAMLERDLADLSIPFDVFREKNNIGTRLSCLDWLDQKREAALELAKAATPYRFAKGEVSS
jgi:hypothetical protein